MLQCPMCLFLPLFQESKHSREWILQDVAQAILESYSRVLESLAYNIVTCIDDVLFADEAARKIA